ncbi:hypothetical protein D3C85_385170 [compost metagenome]
MDRGTRLVDAPRGGECAAPLLLAAACRLAVLLRPAHPRAAAGHPGVRRQVVGQRLRLCTRQAANFRKDLQHGIAVRTEQGRQGHFLQQFDRRGSPVPRLRHQAGHVAQFFDAYAPELPWPAAADDHGGQGLIDHQPGRVGLCKRHPLAGPAQGKRGIGIVVPVAFLQGRRPAAVQGIRHGAAAMPAHARLAKNALAALGAIDMRGRDRLAGVRGSVGDDHQEKACKRRTDQASQHSPP